MMTSTLFINGKVHTQDPANPICSQIAISGNRIIAVGNDLLSGHAASQVVDLEQKVVLPGFLDAHVHFLWGGESLLSIPLDQASSRTAFISLIKNFAAKYPPGSWLRGGGWNEHHFSDGSFPHKDWLDEAAPGHPMILTRHDGHSGIASSAALEIAGITSETPDPPEGVIDRDAQGQPTGLLREAAMVLVMKHLPRESEAEMMRCLEASQAYLLKRGVTSVGDMIHDLNHFRFLQKMAREGLLKVRVNAYLPILKWDVIKELMEKGIFENDWLQFKGLKGFCDGSLGSHTALMLEPYADTPDSAGIYDSDWSDLEKIKATITEADQLGLQTVVHAIGDRAVREVLDVFEEVLKTNGPRDRRFRVEHAQHIHPEDQKRFDELGVIASVQPLHCVDDSLYAEKLLGERCRYAYPFASLEKACARLALGSDWPVSPADPVATIHAAVHRGGWEMDEALELKTAIAGHTSGAAFSCFREQDLGQLKPGALADFVVLKADALDQLELPNLGHDLIEAVYSEGKKVAP
jgi:predicted amidohydrolase YtcJ